MTTHRLCNGRCREPQYIYVVLSNGEQTARSSIERRDGVDEGYLVSCVSYSTEACPAACMPYLVRSAARPASVSAFQCLIPACASGLEGAFHDH